MTITAKPEASGKDLREVEQMADLLECLMMGAPNTPVNNPSKQRKRRKTQRGQARQKTVGTLARAERPTKAERRRAYALWFDNLTHAFLRELSADFTA